MKFKIIVLLLFLGSLLLAAPSSPVGKGELVPNGMFMNTAIEYVVSWFSRNQNF